MKDYNSSTRSRVPVAILSMLGGALLMATLVIIFNKDVTKKEDEVKKQSRAVNVKKVQKQSAQKPKPKPKPKPKKQTPKAPLPSMNSLMGGIAMNIPEFASNDFSGDTKDILGDIAEDAVMSEGTVDSKPRVSQREPMEFPSKALKDGIKGYVIINLLIAKDGTVEIAKILESYPEGVFDNAALNGVRNWRFTPAKYKGKPVKVWAKQKIRFD
ncbi:MAG: TonB family protein [Campylobacterota bacterium]|nr:TonB family protein [Campylobacterota bacterium]